MRTALLLILCLTAMACGGLDNRPLQEGGVRGLLGSSDAARAVVAVLGQPALSTRPGPSGAFELRGVPQGTVELFAIASDTLAVRWTVAVRGGDVVDVGTVQPLPGASVRLKLRASHNQRLDGARVEVQGTPLTTLVPDSTGDVLVGPLPLGCYEVRATVPGFGRFDQSVCLSDTTELELELDLPDTDGTPGREGCLVAGCEATYVCQQDGRCENP